MVNNSEDPHRLWVVIIGSTPCVGGPIEAGQSVTQTHCFAAMRAFVARSVASDSAESVP
jgi:hypothetical protein